MKKTTRPPSRRTSTGTMLRLVRDAAVSGPDEKVLTARAERIAPAMTQLHDARRMLLEGKADDVVVLTFDEAFGEVEMLSSVSDPADLLLISSHFEDIARDARYGHPDEPPE